MSIKLDRASNYSVNAPRALLSKSQNPSLLSNIWCNLTCYLIYLAYAPLQRQVCMPFRVYPLTNVLRLKGAKTHFIF